MKILAKEKISPHKYKTPEGYLVCVDSVLARTGQQTYTRDELFHDGDESEIAVNRTPEEVFSDATLASFENKPLVVDHPDEDVNSTNVREYSVGFVRDIKRGEYDGEPVMLGTLVITDSDAIKKIEDGDYKELSCGYDCDIEDEEHPCQRNIRGNHVALCQNGRAGIAKIMDSVKDAVKLPNDIRKDISRFLAHKSTFTKHDVDVVDLIKELERYFRIDGKKVTFTREGIKGWYRTGDGTLRKDYKFSVDGYDNSDFMISIYADDDYKTTEINGYMLDSVNDADSYVVKWIDEYARSKGFPKSYWLNGKYHKVYDLYVMNVKANSIDEALDIIKQKAGIDPKYITIEEIRGPQGVIKLSTNINEVHKRYVDSTEGEQNMNDAMELSGRTFKELDEKIKQYQHKHPNWKFGDIEKKRGMYVVEVVKDSIRDRRITLYYIVSAGGTHVDEKEHLSENPNSYLYFESEREAEQMADKIGRKTGIQLFVEKTMGWTDSVHDKLIESGSEEAFKKNIATEIRAGKDPKQAAAIAYSVQRENDSDADVEDKLIDPPEKIIKEFENELNKYGIKIVGKGKTWSGRNHYQVEYAGKDIDLHKIFTQISTKLGRVDIPMTWAIGTDANGKTTAGLDLDKQWVEDNSTKDAFSDVPNWFKSLMLEAKNKIGLRSMGAIVTYIKQNSKIDEDTAREWYMQCYSKLGLPAWEKEAWRDEKVEDAMEKYYIRWIDQYSKSKGWDKSFWLYDDEVKANSAKEALDKLANIAVLRGVGTRYVTIVNIKTDKTSYQVSGNIDDLRKRQLDSVGDEESTYTEATKKMKEGYDKFKEHMKDAQEYYRVTVKTGKFFSASLVRADNERDAKEKYSTKYPDEEIHSVSIEHNPQDMIKRGMSVLDSKYKITRIK